MTTNQVCDNLYNTNVKEDNIEQIRDFLSQCDLVKFAKYLPSEDENKNIIEVAIDIVNKTKIELIEENIEINNK